MSVMMQGTAPLRKTGTPNARAIDNSRWMAVVNRDTTFDGRFVYAVKTTGVYCRPGCPSRTAKRENVVFYPDCTRAEAAGFRTCQRCHPDKPSLMAQQATAIEAACRRIETSETMPTLHELAAKARFSPFHFHRLFKTVTGLTPKAYGAAHRTKRMREQLAKGDSSITTAIYDAGFSSSSRFYEKSNAMLGMKPSAFRDGGLRTDIKFATGDCSLGSILVAASEKGICAILLGDDPEALAHDLRNRFPKANLVADKTDFKMTIARVVSFIETPAKGLDLPLDIRGTAFQQRVWQALQKIPAGRTASYADIAKRIGKPTAVRAVATACAANAHAVAVPCHRVVRSDGGLSGYRWGVTRKHALLEREARQSDTTRSRGARKT